MRCAWPAVSSWQHTKPVGLGPPAQTLLRFAGTRATGTPCSGEGWGAILATVSPLIPLPLKRGASTAASNWPSQRTASLEPEQRTRLADFP